MTLYGLYIPTGWLIALAAAAALAMIHLVRATAGYDRRTRAQLKAISKAIIGRKKLMNRSEAALYRRLTTILMERRGDYLLFPQVAMGEILTTGDEKALWAFNAKRLDFLITDTAGIPILAIEYQESGHYQGNARARDAVKRAALDRAGVSLLEVMEGYDPVELLRSVNALLPRS